MIDFFLKYIGAIGLILDIIGACLIFMYGLPEEISRTGFNSLGTEQEDEDEKAKGKKYDRCSKIGFYLLILGFIFQLASSINSVK